MAQDIKELIEKINQEGIQAAEAKAKEIEQEARRKADEVLARARQEAGQLISQTQKELERKKEKERTLLVQAARDMLLSLRKQINATLERIITRETQNVLTAETLYKIILSLAKTETGSEGVVVTLAKDDLKRLEEGFLAKLKDEIKNGLTLKATDDIRAGFTISFDAGKSCFDFSDKAIAEYIGSYLKPRLNELLKGVFSE